MLRSGAGWEYPGWCRCTHLPRWPGPRRRFPPPSPHPALPLPANRRCTSWRSRGCACAAAPQTRSWWRRPWGMPRWAAPGGRARVLSEGGGVGEQGQAGCVEAAVAGALSKGGGHLGAAALGAEQTFDVACGGSWRRQPRPTALSRACSPTPAPSSGQVPAGSRRALPRDAAGCGAPAAAAAQGGAAHARRRVPVVVRQRLLLPCVPEIPTPACLPAGWALRVRTAACLHPATRGQLRQHGWQLAPAPHLYMSSPCCPPAAAAAWW